jgi:heat shock protein HslJ
MVRLPRLGAVVALAVATACALPAADTRSETYGVPSERNTIEGSHWVLDRADSSLRLPDDHPVTLAVDGDQARGVGPCNAYRSGFSLDGSAVSFTGITTTLAACAPVTMAAEREYTRALGAVDTVATSTDRLVLTGPAGIRLAFAGGDHGARLVGRWAVVNVATGDALTSVVLGTVPTVTFSDDGRVALDTGCNVGTGAWRQEGRSLTIEPLTLTARRCEEPPGLMAQESALVRALESTTRAEVTPTTLTLLGTDDTTKLIAEAA